MVRSNKTGRKSRTERYPVNGNLVVDGHRTSVRLEAEMWAALKDVAEREDCSVNDLAGRIDGGKKAGQNFTSAIRVFLMLYYRNVATNRGKRRPARR